MNKRLTLDLPPETIKTMKDLAKERKVSVSQLFEDTVAEYIKKELANYPVQRTLQCNQK